MIWILILVTMAGDIEMQPFSTQAECKQVQEWITTTGKKKGTWRSEVADSVCLKIANPYGKQK